MTLPRTIFDFISLSRPFPNELLFAALSSDRKTIFKLYLPILPLARKFYECTSKRNLYNFFYTRVFLHSTVASENSLLIAKDLPGHQNFSLFRNEVRFKNRYPKEKHRRTLRKTTTPSPSLPLPHPPKDIYTRNSFQSGKTWSFRSGGGVTLKTNRHKRSTTLFAKNGGIVFFLKTWKIQPLPSPSSSSPKYVSGVKKDSMRFH